MERATVVDERQKKPDAPVVPTGRGRAPTRVRVRDLLDGTNEAILEHDGQDYHLRITANGKLILTK